jgi:Domain of unknown function (DUF5916)/Carbohydrate family 9 binding domain-like
MRIARQVACASAFLLALSVAGGTSSAVAAPEQTTVAPAGPAPVPGAAGVLNGPPPPVPPEVLTRDDQGRATLRAVRIDEPLRIDGRLDETVYRDVRSAGEFIQMEPREGDPESEKTEAWVFFDNENVYVAARCWDDHPERWVVTELRRDNSNIFQNESVSVSLDTFHDGRNGFFFQTTPASAIRDQTFTDEANGNPSWNTIWNVKAGRFEGGWTLEMAIPFKSLRYRGAGPQTWGISIRRIIRWKNEITFLTRVPAAYGGNAPFHMSVAATLVGLETPAQSMNLELKPYLTGALTTDRTAAEPFANRVEKNGGFDFKYGLTRSLIADATYRTDFAQVEEDVQQVNLTRFSLLFPEKRDFFLEGQGVFAFGGRSAADVPILFFSRQIGLSQGQAVPVVAGGRLTGTVNKYSLGALNIQTDDASRAGAVATNFSVVRLKRDVLRRSSIGLLATRRAPTSGAAGSNDAVGVDANLSFFTNVALNGYYARTRTPGSAGGDDSSYRGRFDYDADRYGLQVDHLLVGDRFNPEVGFLRRRDFRRRSVTARFSPRLASSRRIRKVGGFASYNYVTNASGSLLENRQSSGMFWIDFDNSDQWNLEYTRDFEYLSASFQIAPNVAVPIGGHNYETVRSYYFLGQQRPLSGYFTVARGTFYGGHKTEASFTAGRAAISTRVNVEPAVTLNWIDLPQGRFRTELLIVRLIVTPSPRSLISSLFQFNQLDHSLSSSVRLRWEYTGGSELFVVYSDARTTSTGGAQGVMNRSFAIKLTRLFRL